VQRCFRDHIDVPPQKVFEVLFQGNVIDKAPSGLHLYEHIQITAWPFVSASRGSEEPKVVGPMLPG
jgi:hypothetical protein